MNTIAVLKMWAGTLPTTSAAPAGTEPETISYSVPYPIKDKGAEAAARILACAYMQSALRDIADSGMSIEWVSPLADYTTHVERPDDRPFWRRVVRHGWAFYTVRCKVALRKTEATACPSLPST